MSGPTTQSDAPLVPPYYAVVFSSVRTEFDDSGYAEMAQRMEQLACEQPGFLKIESVRGENGHGITISYWKTLESIAAWRRHAEHLVAQELGKTMWYQSFELQICRVERVSTFRRPEM